MELSKKPAKIKKACYATIRISVCLSLVLLSAFPARAAELFVRSHPGMGTTFTIYLYATNETQASAAFDAAFEEVERLEETLSNYRDSSELSRINRLAAREAVTTDPEVFGLVQISLEYSKKTGGAFDITIGPLMKAWGFFRASGHYPSKAELETAKAKVGWQNVQLDVGHRTVHFSHKGTELDL